MAPEIVFIDRVEQAVANIERLNDWLTDHPGKLDQSIRSVRRWYAAWTGDGWRFGFSKFIGYADMTLDRYQMQIGHLDGGQTEGASPLQRLSVEVGAGCNLHESLARELLTFLRFQNREAPRPDHSIRVLLTRPATPQSFVISQECQKVAWQNGYRRALGETDGWARYGSTTAKGTVWLAAGGHEGPWFLALDHIGIVDDLKLPQADMPGPGLVRYAYPNLTALYALMSRVYQLGVTLPDGPLEEFRAAVANLPKSTEAERLVIQRVGQDIFRDRLMTYWQSRCPLTGITDPALLRASHIIAWKDCASDAERLDVHNGLLLSALWDAAFDRGLVTFTDDGRPEFSQKLTETARAELRWHAPITLTDKHRARLVWHRANPFTLNQ